MPQPPSSYLYPSNNLFGLVPHDSSRADGAAPQHGLTKAGPLHVSTSPQDYWGLALEPNHSYVSSCAVDSAHNSCPMDWDTAPVRDQSRPAACHALPTARVLLTNKQQHQKQYARAAAADGAGASGAPPSREDALGSAAAAAAAAANPWAWLSDVATAPPPPAQPSATATALAPQTAAAAAHADKGMHSTMLQYHNASRRLFMTGGTPDVDPKSNMQWKLQQQAQQLQAELALATQQLQLQMQIGAPPPLPLVG